MNTSGKTVTKKDASIVKPNMDESSKVTKDAGHLGIQSKPKIDNYVKQPEKPINVQPEQAVD